MSKLLRSDFRRLFRSKLFYLGILAVAISVGHTLVNNIYYLDVMKELEIPLDNLLFMGTTVLGFAMAIFTSFFVGTEYSDKTMRNKVIVGNSRLSIYFSNFIVTTLAALIMLIVGSGAVISVGAFWMGGLVTSYTVLLPQILCCLLAVVALNAIYVLFSMLIPSRAIGVIVILVTAILVVYLLPTTLYNKLSEPPMIDGGGYVDESGVLIEYPDKENRYYISGTSRKILQTLYDALPTSQMEQFGYDEMPTNINLFPLYSVLLISVFSTAGVCVYKRRDLK